MNAPAIRRSAAPRYAAAIFLSSSLLFLIEPIAAKRLLPLLGGSAAVWTACLVFFQCALLLGYLVAHWLATRLTVRAQVGTYLALLVLSMGQLSLAVDPILRADASHPIASVLWLLTVLIGAPFVTLSATGPLLQAWYAREARSAGRATVSSDTARTYRLFAISNIGSLVSLLVYPWLIEPRLRLHDQSAALAVGFVVLAGVCGLIAWSLAVGRPRATTGASDEPLADPRPDAASRDYLLWVALAACASLLLSAITNHLSQNVAAIPLLWIVPLVVYLLTFVIAFGGGRWHPRWLVLLLAVAALAGAGWMLYRGDLTVPVPRKVATFCAVLFALCLFCHAELYRRRPATHDLTTFYICVAAGGALGAVLVGIAAPMLLPGNYELTFGLGLAAALAIAVTWTSGWIARGFWVAATAVLAALLVNEVHADREINLMHVRNFYGTLHVTEDYEPAYKATERTLYHGSIEHGQQVFRVDMANSPTTYYGHPSGVGLALDLCCGHRPRRVGVIGLGTGTLAAYGRPGDVFRFYDINPAVEPIARGFFTYLRDSPARIEVVNGDARISLASEPPQQYDVLAIDAFSGDAIPVHLMTTQALALYRRHLRAGGIVAFHVSNRYLDLAPVVRQLAEHEGLHAELVSSPDDAAHDLASSDWVLVTDNQEFLSLPELVKARETITIPRGLRVWTDDYNSLLPVLGLRSDE